MEGWKIHIRKSLSPPKCIDAFKMVPAREYAAFQGRFSTSNHLNHGLNWSNHQMKDANRYCEVLCWKKALFRMLFVVYLEHPNISWPLYEIICGTSRTDVYYQWICHQLYKLLRTPNSFVSDSLSGNRGSFNMVSSTGAPRISQAQGSWKKWTPLFLKNVLGVGFVGS